MSLPFAEWLPAQRWISPVGELISATATSVVRCATIWTLMLVDAQYADGTRSATRCWSAGTSNRSPEYAERAEIGSADGRIGFDALLRSRCRLVPHDADGGLEAVRGEVTFSAEPWWICPSTNRPRCSRRAEQHQRDLRPARDPEGVPPRRGSIPISRLNRCPQPGRHPNVPGCCSAATKQQGRRAFSRWHGDGVRAELGRGWDMASASARDPGCREGDLAADEGGWDFAAGESSCLR